jgi:hypothetical protein
MDLVNELLKKRQTIQNSIDFFSCCDPLIEEVDAYFIGKQIRFLEGKLDTLNKKIERVCNHTYVEDWIDIDPDRSVKIKYCSICESLSK